MMNAAITKFDVTMCEVKEAWKMSGVNALFYLVAEIKKGAKDFLDLNR